MPFFLSYNAKITHQYLTVVRFYTFAYDFNEKKEYHYHIEGI